MSTGGCAASSRGCWSPESSAARVARRSCCRRVAGSRRRWRSALGLGARNAFDAEACIALGADAARRALYLGARTLALPLPDPHAGDLELSDRIDALVAGAMAAVAELGADLKLLLVPPQAEVAAARQAAAALASKPFPSSVALRLDGMGRATDLTGPHGASASPTQPLATCQVKRPLTDSFLGGLAE